MFELGLVAQGYARFMLEIISARQTIHATQKIVSRIWELRQEQCVQDTVLNLGTVSRN